MKIISNRQAHETSKEKILNAVAHATQTLGYAAMRDKQLKVVENFITGYGSDCAMLAFQQHLTLCQSKKSSALLWL